MDRKYSVTTCYLLVKLMVASVTLYVTKAKIVLYVIIDGRESLY